MKTRLRHAMAALLLTAAPAFAHHGWSWTEDGFFELTGTIKTVYLGNPHAALDVDVEGEVWKVELAPPAATQNAGFIEGSAKPGDEVKALGNRSRDAAERRMKAVRITVGGQVYDIYPARAPS